MVLSIYLPGYVYLFICICINIVCWKTRKLVADFSSLSASASILQIRKDILPPNGGTTTIHKKFCIDAIELSDIYSIFKFPNCFNNFLYRFFYSDFKHIKFCEAFKNETRNMRFLRYLGTKCVSWICLCSFLKKIIVFIFTLMGKHNYQSGICQCLDV